MSYILDALRKSERERRNTDALNVSDLTSPTAVNKSYRSAALPIVVALLLLSAVVVIAGYLWWPGTMPAPVATSTVSTTPSVPLPAGSEPAPPPALAKTSPLHAETAVRTSAEAPPTLKPNAFAPVPNESAVRNLAKEARIERPKPQPMPPVPASLPTREFSYSTTAKTDGVKFLGAMPPEFRRGLPELAVNIHIYSPTPAERILYINNRQYQAGDKIRDDLWVEEIVEDGAVLAHNGQRFKLPRPR